MCILPLSFILCPEANKNKVENTKHLMYLFKEFETKGFFSLQLLNAYIYFQTA